MYHTNIGILKVYAGGKLNRGTGPMNTYPFLENELKYHLKFAYKRFTFSTKMLGTITRSPIVQWK